MRRAGWVVVVALLAVLTVGCGPDLDRVTFPRTTIPAGGSTAADRLSADWLRLVDPCDLLDTTVLAGFGTPEDNVGHDYNSCRNYMKATSGESLSFTVRVGESTTSGSLDRATEDVGGFRAEESTVDGACFVTLIVEEPEPDLAVDLQVGLDTGDACTPARTVAASIAQRLRTTAEVREPEPGSLLALDPCTTGADLPGNALPGAEDADPYGLHQCSWAADRSEIELRFGLRPDPTAAPEPGGEAVDLGGGLSGIKQARDDSFPSCALDWLHRATGDGVGDVVSITVRDVGATGIDVCGIALDVGTNLAARLPRE